MTRVSEAFVRDANNYPIDNLGLTSTKSITFVGATTGAVGATTLFSVTGVVALKIFGVISGADVTGSGTIEVGVSGNTASLIAQTTGTDLDNGDIWIDATAPATVEALPTTFIVKDDVVQTIATNTLTAGTVTYYCIWSPISQDGLVESA